VCTLAVFFRTFDEYPLVIAANRDERYDRPSGPPAIWDTEPRILAGKDLSAGGTWLGVNERGLLVGILNRRSTGASIAQLNSRSRGLLCLDLLRFATAADARTFVRAQRHRYQPFTVVAADPAEGWAAYNAQGEIHTCDLKQGLHVFSNTVEFNDRSEKVDRAYGEFAQLIEEPQRIPNDLPDWVESLAGTLSNHTLGNGSSDSREALCVHGEISGTVSSSIIYYSRLDRRFYNFFSPGPPCRSSFGDALVLNTR
jgi:uncharacterized protein with NRDE domain